MTATLEVTHDTRYDYAAPVSLAHHLAHLQPLADAHQELLAFDLEISPEPALLRLRHDAQGNAERHFSLEQPHRRLTVRATSRVRVAPRFAALDAESGPAWDELARRLRYVARAPFLPEVEFALPSPYVPRLHELRGYAAPSFAAGRPLAAAALDLMHRIHADFRYQSQSTAVDTPLAQVWATRRGVCQDFAHLMAGAMRMLGLPVRYVSGYLLTHAPEGGAAMQGADASHAWVQVWCPGTEGVPADGWLDLDPTNDLVPGLGHVRLAVGRDFGDVTPLRGVIRGGGGSHVLTVGVSTRVIGSDSNPERELLERTVEEQRR
ncbi:MAG: transglutaminase family protein [Burkholderiales bacterium]|nr:transglutaminase family protein [Burkholderiales bacterium]